MTTAKRNFIVNNMKFHERYRKQQQQGNDLLCNQYFQKHMVRGPY